MFHRPGQKVSLQADKHEYEVLFADVSSQRRKIDL
jgi:hypothetical protein